MSKNCGPIGWKGATTGNAEFPFEDIFLEQKLSVVFFGIALKSIATETRVNIYLAYLSGHYCDNDESHSRKHYILDVSCGFYRFDASLFQDHIPISQPKLSLNPIVEVHKSLLKMSLLKS